MLIAVLIVIWIAALGPVAFRRYVDRRATSSVDRFHYRTWLFRRTYPGLALSADGVPTGTSGGRPVGQGQLRAERLRIRRRRERRRRVLAAISATFVATLIFGAIPALRPLWDLAIADVLAGVGYLALAAGAAREEALTIERLRKVVPIQGTPTGSPPEYGVRLAVGSRQSFGAAPMIPRPAFRLVESPTS